MFSSLAVTLSLLSALAADEQPPAPVQTMPRKAAAAAEQVPAGKYYAQSGEGAPSPVHVSGDRSNEFAVNRTTCTNFDYNSKSDYCGGDPYSGCCNPRGDCGGYAGYPPSHWTSAPGGGYSLASCDGDHRGHCDHCGPFKSCCNMTLHHAYYPQANGYYYFRPYNYTHICQQQHVITAWGGDRRHPYDTRFVFDKVYADLESEGLIAPDKPVDDEDAGVLGPMPVMPMKTPPAPPAASQQTPPAPTKAAPGDLDNGSNTRNAVRSVVRVVLEKE